jgi:hypothetical protein
VEREGNMVRVYMAHIRSHQRPDNIEGIMVGDTVYFHHTNVEQDWDVLHGFAIKGMNTAEVLVAPGQTKTNSGCRRGRACTRSTARRSARRCTRRCRATCGSRRGLEHAAGLADGHGRAALRELTQRRGSAGGVVPPVRPEREERRHEEARSRLLLALAALLLCRSFVLPLWSIRIVAPQYNDGLGMFIGLRDIWGHTQHDIQNINILNHYIGMKPIVPAEVDVLQVMPWAWAC